MSKTAGLFRKASKQQARARVAMSGPSGSGKTFWSLTWAKALADGGPVAVIDTERGSASIYADQFEFDVLEMRPPYHPERLIEALASAEANGYKVVVIDSLTHFWSGQGGVLEIVDQAATRFKGNTHAAWQVGTPIQQKMVDALLGYDGHLIATMRAKTEWVMEPDDRGRVAPRKVGLAPQQRSDIEFEFTLMLELDAVSHRATVSKTRFAQYADRVFNPDEAYDKALGFGAWLGSGEQPPTRNEIDAVKQKIEALQPYQREYLKSRWVEEGLPKVDNLNNDQQTLVLDLIGEATTVEPEPAPEDEFEEAF